MATVDPAHELAALEKKLDEALTKFPRMPGAMWLATSSIIEASARLGELSLEASLARRHADMLERARRARDDAGPRSSENDVSAITAWLEVAQQRTPLELAVKAALADVAAHRQAYVGLGEPPRSRAELEAALAARELDVVTREKRLQQTLPDGATALVARLRARDPELSPEGLDDLDLVARAQAAEKQLGTRLTAAWSLAPFPSATLLGALACVKAAGLLGIAYVVGQATGSRALVAAAVVGAAVVGVGLVAAAYARRRRELADQRAMSDWLAYRERDEVLLGLGRIDHALLVTAARKVGALDAFGATEAGRTLESREAKLVTLAPWIRETVGGFTAEEAVRFAP